MTTTLTVAERIKLRLLADGLAISLPALEHLREANGERKLTPADYASTTGLILRLDDDVWVNAPFAEYNANFVDNPPHLLDLSQGELIVRSKGDVSQARFWLPPAYHDEVGPDGQPYNRYVFTHGDRARISPIQGCAMTCKFCNIPYEDRYGTKPIKSILAALDRALHDDVQPARHVLISGGTPKPDHFAYLRSVYEAVTDTFPVPVDIMMVPVDGLLDPRSLRAIGVRQLSINIEIYNRELAARYMRQKHQQGIAHYLDFLAAAAEVFGPGQVRSMLMVGLEPIEDTLAGVRAIVARGAVPVLSPFRPDPATPLAAQRPPTAESLEEAYVRANDIVRCAGGFLGPDCIPCTHNTLTFASSMSDDTPQYLHGLPTLA